MFRTLYSTIRARRVLGRNFAGTRDYSAFQERFTEFVSELFSENENQRPRPESSVNKEIKSSFYKNFPADLSESLQRTSDDTLKFRLILTYRNIFRLPSDIVLSFYNTRISILPYNRLSRNLLVIFLRYLVYNKKMDEAANLLIKYSSVNDSDLVFNELSDLIGVLYENMKNMSLLDKNLDFHFLWFLHSVYQKIAYSPSNVVAFKHILKSLTATKSKNPFGLGLIWQREDSSRIDALIGAFNSMQLLRPRPDFESYVSDLCSYLYGGAALSTFDKKLGFERATNVGKYLAMNRFDVDSPKEMNVFVRLHIIRIFVQMDNFAVVAKFFKTYDKKLRAIESQLATDNDAKPRSLTHVKYVYYGGLVQYLLNYETKVSVEQILPMLQWFKKISKRVNTIYNLENSKTKLDYRYILEMQYLSSLMTLNEGDINFVIKCLSNESDFHRLMSFLFKNHYFKFTQGPALGANAKSELYFSNYKYLFSRCHTFLEKSRKDVRTLLNYYKVLVANYAHQFSTSDNMEVIHKIALINSKFFLHKNIDISTLLVPKLENKSFDKLNSLIVQKTLKQIIKLSKEDTRDSAILKFFNQVDKRYIHKNITKQLNEVKDMTVLNQLAAKVDDVDVSVVEKLIDNNEYIVNLEKFTARNLKKLARSIIKKEQIQIFNKFTPGLPEKILVSEIIKCGKLELLQYTNADELTLQYKIMLYNLSGKVSKDHNLDKQTYTESLALWPRFEKAFEDKRYYRIGLLKALYFGYVNNPNLIAMEKAYGLLSRISERPLSYELRPWMVAILAKKYEKVSKSQNLYSRNHLYKIIEKYRKSSSRFGSSPKYERALRQIDK